MVEEASYLLLELSLTRARWKEVAGNGRAFLNAWPESRRIHDARWLTAKALRNNDQVAEAYRIYEAIWYDTPGSRWAVDAHDRLKRIEGDGHVRSRTRPANDRYKFIKVLRKVGLHKEALDEITEVRSRFPLHEQTNGILFMKAMSLHDLRRNEDCVSTVDELRRQFPRSQWVPAAAIYAVKALRRFNSTSRVRYWSNWVVDNYPRHDKAFEALYDLGVYLGNVVSEEEGLKVLERLIETGRERPIVVDAL